MEANTILKKLAAAVLLFECYLREGTEFIQRSSLRTDHVPGNLEQGSVFASD